MCGRYGRRSDKQYIAEHYTMRRKTGEMPPMPPGYNITPGTFQPVIRLSQETGERECILMRWGLSPVWAPKSLMNCVRDDKLATTWRRQFKHRCLIPAEFFYEWEVLTPEEKKRKISKPWAVSLKDDRLFSFGGVWDSWTDKGSGHLLESFSIITTEPNDVLEPFHNRCPLIIEPKRYDRWLAESDPDNPMTNPFDLVKTYPGEEMKAWKVSPLKGDSPQLLEPRAESVQSQESLF
jgi:putative SOS response-associated peptidase YedK